MTLIVEVPGAVMSTGLGEEAVRPKSVTITVPVDEWERVPLVPVTVIVYVPAEDEEQETVAAPDPVTLDGLMVPHVSPDGTESVRLTVSPKPFRAVIVIVDWAVVPTVTADGEEAEIAKSLTA